MISDQELLRRYTDAGSNEAFSLLLERYIGLVWATACRVVQNHGHADDITQSVFLLLAQKAAKLVYHDSLQGWLYRTAYLQALNHRRGERRRWQTEQSAMAELPSNAPHQNDLWQQIAPELDRCLISLKQLDRSLILMRFFRQMKWSDIALHHQTTEAAAKMRVKRALEQLRLALQRAGVSLTSITLLSEVLDANAAGKLATEALATLHRNITTRLPATPATAGDSLLNPLGLGLKIAAVATLLLIVGYLVYQPDSPSDSEPSSNETRTRSAGLNESPVGGQRLVDGAPTGYHRLQALARAEDALKEALYNRERLNQTSRRAVEAALALYGTEAPRAVPILIEALQSPLPEEGRWHRVVSDGYWVGKEHDLALHGLQELGPQASAALPFLLEQLNQDRVFGQSYYVRVIRALQPGPEITEHLIDALDTRYFVYNVMGRELAELIAALAPGDPEQLNHAYQTLRDNLSAFHPTLRVTSAYALALLPEGPDPILADELQSHLLSEYLTVPADPPYIESVQDFMRAVMDHSGDESDVAGRRHLAILAFGAFDSAAKTVIEEVKKIATETRYQRTRETAFATLAKLDADAQDRYAPLQHFLADQHEGKRLAARIATNRANRDDLIAGLTWQSSRTEAVQAIHEQGPEGMWAIPYLIEALESPERGALGELAEALSDLDPTTLLAGLKSDKPGVVTTVANRLASLGEEAHWALEALEEARSHLPSNVSNLDTAIRQVAPDQFTPIAQHDLLEAAVNLYIQSQSMPDSGKHMALWQRLYTYGPQLSGLTQAGIYQLLEDVAQIDPALRNSLRQEITKHIPNVALQPHGSGL